MLPESQRAVHFRMPGVILRPHPQRAGARGRLHRRERRLVRIVTFNALPPRLRSSGRIPVAVRPAMRAVFPIAIDGPMALCADKLRLVPWDFTAKIVDKSVSVPRMVAIEAARVDTMLELDFRVLGQLATGLFRRGDDRMAVATAIGIGRRPVPGCEARPPNGCDIGRPDRSLHGRRCNAPERKWIQGEQGCKDQQDGRNPEGTYAPRGGWRVLWRSSGSSRSQRTSPFHDPQASCETEITILPTTYDNLSPIMPSASDTCKH